ncbi:nucleotidyltransferase domain-containing protein [Marinobacter bohaiensis]|uniref:nucleotidyltransferase domain-containing protein n=1 Tax=Marinobacter bohaiensis TaxID=2201898 RepID=UPI001D179010|nr:nucleotidyltransferase domain-containing protein [Marinobacter bohaiensis]
MDTQYGYKITHIGYNRFMTMPTHDTRSSRTSLADALFSKTRQKMLRLFFASQGKGFSIAELIDQANAGSGAVQRELERLVDSGLVRARTLGRQKRYQANVNSPIYSELSSLVGKILGPEQHIADALQSIADQISLALIYGSVARKTDHADSDIDLMLVSDSLTLEDVFAAVEPVESALGRPINPTLYKHEEFDKRRTSNNPFLTKVLDGPYILLKGSIDEYRSTG